GGRDRVLNESQPRRARGGTTATSGLVSGSHGVDTIARPPGGSDRPPYREPPAPDWRSKRAARPRPDAQAGGSQRMSDMSEATPSSRRAFSSEGLPRRNP